MNLIQFITLIRFGVLLQSSFFWRWANLIPLPSGRTNLDSIQLSKIIKEPI